MLSNVTKITQFKGNTIVGCDPKNFRDSKLLSPPPPSLPNLLPLLILE